MSEDIKNFDRINMNDDNISSEKMKDTMKIPYGGNLKRQPAFTEVNNEEKLLTIIIPTYNMEKYLRHCLDSLIVPNMDKVEVLVINDGSKDSSSVIGHEYQDKYPQTFRIIDKENGNYGSCVNCGLKEAKGKYVKVLDADDSFDNKNFEGYVDFLCNTDADFILNDYCIVNEKDEVTSTKVYGIKDGTNVFDEYFRNVLLIKRLQMHAVAYRTENLRNIGYHQTEGISYTDQQWIFTPLTTVDTIAYYGKVLYRYLVGRRGQTMNPTAVKKGVSQNQKCVIDLLKDYVAFHDIRNMSIKKYIDDRVLMSLKAIYYSYLVRFRDIDIAGLKDFDTELKKISPKLIELADSISIDGINFLYIRHWHTTGQRDNSLSYKLVLLYSRIYSHIRSSFNK